MFNGIFPGQGNQHTGMGKDLYERFPLVTKMYDEANKCTGIDIKSISFEGSSDVQRDTTNLQLITYMHSCAVYSLICEQHPRIQFAKFAGHSVGEYAALYAAGYLSLQEGLNAVKKRAELMSRIHFEEPSLVAILGASKQDVNNFCRSTNGDLEIALCNSPGNYVIGGHPDKIKEHYDNIPGKRKKALQVAGPFHTSHYKEIANEFREFLKTVKFNEPTGIVYANSTAQIHVKTNIIERLAQQLYNLSFGRE